MLAKQDCGSYDCLFYENISIYKNYFGIYNETRRRNGHVFVMVKWYAIRALKIQRRLV